MRLTTTTVAAALIVGAWGVAAWAGGPGGHPGGGFQGKKVWSSSPASTSGGSKSEPDRFAPGKGDAGGKGESGVPVTKGESAGPAAGVAGSRRATDVEQLLTELGALRDRRIISDDEYQRYRRQVLDDFVRPTSR